jgi:hypothetical protein
MNICDLMVSAGGKDISPAPYYVISSMCLGGASVAVVWCVCRTVLLWEGEAVLCELLHVLGVGREESRVHQGHGGHGGGHGGRTLQGRRLMEKQGRGGAGGSEGRGRGGEGGCGMSH